ncbi:MAG TPA: aminodeoxychorismate/anthranilate synthase component II [Candidatus Tumulicola sp.]|nr:aminodeoxychorismate/anthranilate synthase component II [Candidatus Tumulicola sp.]
MKREVLILDNYDSFTYNLAQMIGAMGVTVRVQRSDAVSIDALATAPPAALIISPGPGTPDRAGHSLAAIAALYERIPILGVCLGHQAIGAAFGGRVVRLPAVMHGKTSSVRHTGGELFAGVSSPFRATRYHSLVVAGDSIPQDLEVIAQSEDHLVMGLRHRRYPVFGVQFHPESVLTAVGPRIVRNFLGMAGFSR